MFSVLFDFFSSFPSLKFHFTFSEDCRKIQRGIKRRSYLSDAKSTHSYSLKFFHHTSFFLPTIGLITSRYSGNEPALLFPTLIGEDREDDGQRADTDNCITVCPTSSTVSQSTSKLLREVLGGCNPLCRFDPVLEQR